MPKDQLLIFQNPLVPQTGKAIPLANLFLCRFFLRNIQVVPNHCYLFYPIINKNWITFLTVMQIFYKVFQRAQCGGRVLTYTKISKEQTAISNYSDVKQIWIRQTIHLLQWCAIEFLHLLHKPYWNEVTLNGDRIH